MKKTLTSLVIAVLSIGCAFAQRVQISGTVLDKQTRQGEPAAILQFFKAPDTEKPIAFTTTDTEGRFVHTLTGKGDYSVLFSNMGRKSVTVPFTINEGDTAIDLGEILIEDDIETLKAGTVTAQRPLVKMDVDKMTYDVAHDVDSQTSTVLDMLRKVPMVTVDGQDNITVNGSSSFQVYVDGKPNQMISQNPGMVFKMMPASTVKDIQVITNPGVRYDAEGVGGVLNITTNTEVTGGAGAAEGQYGNVRLNATTRGGGLGLYYSAQKGKWAMSLNANGMYMNMPGTAFTMEREQYSDMGTTTITTSSSSKTKMPLMMGTLSASYEINSNNLLSGSVGLMGMNVKADGQTENTMSGPFFGEGISYSGTSFSKIGSNSITGSLDYQHTSKANPQRIFTLSYQYSGSPSVNDSRNTFSGVVIPGIDMTDRRIDGQSNEQSNILQADYTAPLGEKSTLSSGLKYTYRHSSSINDQYSWDGDWSYDKAKSMDYDFYNNIGAAYLEWSGTYGKIGLKAGARYEYTFQSIKYNYGGPKDFKTSYGTLVPSASIQYTISPMSNIGLSYNMRISRPGITYLNPFVDTSDPTSRSYGNSDLEVERGHNISLVYNRFSSKFMLNLTARYSFTPDGISEYSFLGDDNLMNTTYGNIVKNSSAGLNVFANWNAGPKTRIYVNGGLDWVDLRSEVLGQSNSGLSYNAIVGFQQTLPWDLRLSANTVLMGKSYSLQGSTPGINLAILGLTKSILDDRISFSLSATSHIGKGKYLSMKTVSEGPDFKNTTDMKLPIRQLSFSVSFSFGKSRNVAVKSAQRTIEADDILNSENAAATVGTSMMGGGL
ncbi:MAG: TonB-dependent receptor [Bacteroidales bacterium]|nr:TonB-dependent receptor [Bacteroidales bacterium]